MLFADPAFISFEIINNKALVISEYRYGAFITQVFPLMAVGLGLTLKGILLVYSASFYLFYLAAALVIAYVFKQPRLSILLAIYHLIFVSDVFFWPNNEVHQACAWMMLSIAAVLYLAVQNERRPVWVYCFILLATGMSIISHVLIIVPFLFLWMYTAIHYRVVEKKRKMAFAFSALIVLFFFIRIYLSYASWYDGVKLEGVKNLSFQSITNALANAHAMSFLRLLGSKYVVALLLFGMGVFSLVEKKKWGLLLITACFALVYYVLVTLTFSDAINAFNLFYFESQWMGLAIILASPLVFDMNEQAIPRKFITYGFMGLILVQKVWHFYGSEIKFSNRLDRLETIVTQMRTQKVDKAYQFKNADHDEMMVIWGVPVETMILSALESPENAVTYKIYDQVQPVSAAVDSVYTAFRLVPVSVLNKRYFGLANSTFYKEFSE